jgi:AraC-like DNA-binding protein
LATTPRPRVWRSSAKPPRHLHYYESSDLELTAARYGQIMGFTESSFVAPSPFWVSFASVALGAVQLSRTVATAAQIRQVPSDNVMMIISQRGSTSVESRNNEIVSRRGDVAIVPPFDVNLYQSMDLAEDFVISTDLGSIARHVVMQGNDRQVRSALSKPLGFDLTSAVGAQCYRAIQFAWSQLTDPAMPEPTPVLEAAYEELLLSALSTLLLPALREDVQADRQDLGSDLVRRACELIRARADDPIRIADIAAALGVSIRHLQAGFRRHLGTTPQRFLSDCRLERAHSMLQAALPGETVTAIALECGFGNLGEFASRYRRRFGEKPSETFRRAAE